MKTIAFHNVSKHYAGIVALRPTTLEVAAGEFLTLLGPSGSGKSTLLNVAAGHLSTDSGRLEIGGTDVTDLPPQSRNIGMVFQNYALFPHMTVAENVAYGLRVRRVPKGELRQRVEEALRMVQLEGFGPRGIKQLSGGQQQRVALARALVINPNLLLLDEPMGALDRKLRQHLQLEIRSLHRRLGHTMLYVTHDQEEALVLSDRIAIFRAGSIEQVGTARDLYDNPINAFVAGFLGESNLIAGRVKSLAGGMAEVESEALGGPIRGAVGSQIAVGAGARALIRPEKIRPTPGGQVTKVEEVIFLGDTDSLRVSTPSGQALWLRGHGIAAAIEDDTITIGWNERDIRILPESS